MSDPNRSELPPPLPSAMSQEEILRQKLLLEIKQLRTPVWRSTPAIVALIALAGSILGNITQYVNGQKTIAQAQRTLDAERLKFQEQQNRLQYEFELREREKAPLKVEQDRLRGDLEVWDREIFKLENAILIQSNIDTYDSTDDKILLERKKELRAKVAEKLTGVERQISELR